MALIYFTLTGKVPFLPELRNMVDWFQFDIGQSPDARAAEEKAREYRDPEPHEPKPDPDEEELPF